MIDTRHIASLVTPVLARCTSYVQLAPRFMTTSHCNASESLPVSVQLQENLYA